MAATWEWLWNVYSDSSATLDAGGYTNTRQIPIPLDASVQRLIHRRMSRGDLLAVRDDMVPAPASGNSECTVTTQYGAGDQVLVFNQRSPMEYVAHWVVSGGLGGSGYWTWTCDDRLSFDMDLRRGAAIESAHQLVINFSVSVEFFNQTDQAARVYPSFVSWTSVGILLSRPV